MAPEVEHDSCPIEALLELADQAGADWLRGAVEAHLRGEPINIALGLAGGDGQPTARRRYLRRKRDRYLRAAWHAVEGAIGPWDRTLRLNEEVRRVESLLPTMRHRAEPPAHFSEVRRLVFLAARPGESLPGLRRLHDLCNSCPVSIAEIPSDDDAQIDN